MSTEPNAETAFDDGDGSDDDDEEEDEADKDSVPGTVTESGAMLAPDVVGDAGSLVDAVVVTVLLGESTDVEVELATVVDVGMGSPERELTALSLLLLVWLMVLLLLLLLLLLTEAVLDEVVVVDDEDARRWSSASDGAVVATAAPA